MPNRSVPWIDAGNTTGNIPCCAGNVKWLRKNLPDVYAKLRKKAGLAQTGRPKG